MDKPTVISLSTIPSRFGLIERPLRSLLAQDPPAREVRLYIPRSYRRFPGWDGSLPKVPDGVSIHRCEVDYGPATKILPAARDLKGQAVDILFCDDDQAYDSGWHRRFKKAARRKPDACIVEIGYSFPDIADEDRPADRLPRGLPRRRDFRYRLQRLLSLYRRKPYLTTAGYVDMLAGFAGVLVRPEWFDEAFYDIPEVMWTVDDPWLSGHLERRGVPIWMSGAGYRLRGTGVGQVDALENLVEGAHDRMRADLLVIDYFRERYGVWPRSATAPRRTPAQTPTLAELARRQG